MRWAIVVTLKSGKKATYSKRGRVDWSNTLENAMGFLDVADKLRENPIGYLKPNYGIYGPASILRNNLDVVVGIRAVPEGEYNVREHHTIPTKITT